MSSGRQASARRRNGRPGAAGLLYSSFVAFMKWLLPVLAVGLVGLVAIWPELAIEDNLIKVEAISISPSEIDSVNMQNARYQGIDEQSQRYNLRAISAVQSKTLQDTFELDKPQADIALQDGTWLALNADTGSYDRTGQHLDLFGTVTVYHDRGHEMTTPSARIDLETGEAVSESPVRGQSPLGTLTAEGFRLAERGDVVIFTGKSRLVLYKVDQGLGGQ